MIQKDMVILLHLLARMDGNYIFSVLICSTNKRTSSGFSTDFHSFLSGSEKQIFDLFISNITHPSFTISEV